MMPICCIHSIGLIHRELSVRDDVSDLEIIVEPEKRPAPDAGSLVLLAIRIVIVERSDADMVATDP